MPTAPTHQPGHPAATHRLTEIGLRALYELHHQRYLDYAHLLLGPTDAHLALRASFEYLTESRSDILGTANPAEHIWQAVRQRIHLLAGPRPLQPVAHLKPALQDAVLLHLALGYPVTDVAAMTGTEPAHVHARLRTLGAQATQR
ncbi:hypothetical protein ACIRST_41905 [Kitasatospora sp. NPDC101447]|uniref:hypothetical protein n=1 Tax=Kitasatospora sp. NPDC101447 TaxID=3364102 RepID=UPI00381E1F94